MRCRPNLLFALIFMVLFSVSLWIAVSLFLPVGPGLIWIPVLVVVVLISLTHIVVGALGWLLRIWQRDWFDIE